MLEVMFLDAGSVKVLFFNVAVMTFFVAENGYQFDDFGYFLYAGVRIFRISISGNSHIPPNWLKCSVIQSDSGTINQRQRKQLHRALERNN
jgi:hypothetical protein